MNNILITGAAGFVGFHISKKLCELNYNVIGIDNINDYYSVELKQARLRELNKLKNFRFEKFDLLEMKRLENIFDKEKVDYVLHLAAQAGVRYSIQNPKSYIDSNIVGFGNILEVCRHHKVKHLVFASSSSVYGANKRIPFSVNDPVDHPVSLYAATKKSNELMAHAYANLYKIPVTGLRFFTVYGPWGRPDMAYFSFTKDIIDGTPIKVFNFGNMQRDFTYIEDIVDGVIKVIFKIPNPNSNWDALNPETSSSFAPYKIYNIGNNQPVKLLDFIKVLEENIGQKAKLEMLPMQPGDVVNTYADITQLANEIGFIPTTSIEIGIKSFVKWYRDFYKDL